MKLDILVFAAHPDDAELSASGTILAHIAAGKKVGIVDLTRGELGTRGSAELREEEAKAATQVLGISIRENMGFADGFFADDQLNNLALISIIRKYQPEIILANAIEDRHPDHGNGSKIVSRACFLSGLIKIETFSNGIKQDAWRPKAIYHYIQDRYIKPDFVVDITPFWEKKKEAIKTFQSQFFNPGSQEPETYISKEDFFAFVEARAREMGHSIGVGFGEGFTREKQIGVKNLFDLL